MFKYTSESGDIEKSRSVSGSNDSDSVVFKKLTGWGQLGLLVLVIGLLWMKVLPLIGRQDSVAEHIERQEQLGIDPSAMFYSELEIAERVARKSKRIHERHSDNFWHPQP